MGRLILLDSNIILYHLQGKLRDPLPVDTYSISVVSEIEVRSFPGMGASERTSIEAFLSSLSIIPLRPDIKERTIDIRISTKLRIPDAIVVATALTLGMPLYTNDSQILRLANVNATALPLK